MCDPITTFGRNPFCIFQRFCRAARKPCQHERPTRFILIRIKRQRRGSLRQNMKTCPAAFAYGSDFLCWSRHGQEAAILPSRQSCCEDSAGFDRLSCNRGRNCQKHPPRNRRDKPSQQTSLRHRRLGQPRNSPPRNRPRLRMHQRNRSPQLRCRRSPLRQRIQSRAPRRQYRRRS